MEWNEIGTVDELFSIKSRKKYRLSCDIDCKNRKITKILGDFSGVIDGNGHCIKNLIILEDELWTDTQPIALFYTMSQSIIKNIVLSNLRIEIPKSVYKPSVAALCVDASDTVFENISVEASVNYSEILPLVYESNNCKYENIRLSKNMIETKYE